METKEPNTLMDGLFSEMNRVRELITEYKNLPNGAGMFGAAIMTAKIQNAERAIKNNVVVDMIQTYEELKSCE